jgi:hypothetical protein
MRDGNVAFKVTWVYGKYGPFTAPCTPQGREINIRKMKRVWCSQPECPCFRLYERGNQESLPTDEMPCYDSMIFEKWSFSGGVYHHGDKKGEPIPFKYFQPGKLAFFTSRNQDMIEAERIIIGCYEIAGAEFDTDFEGIVAAPQKGTEIRINNFQYAPRFWDFHRQNGPPRWGTGLFRYLSDQEAKAMHQAIVEVAKRV